MDVVGRPVRADPFDVPKPFGGRYGLDYEADEPVRRGSSPQLKMATLNNGDVTW
jgi:hypothetical protein